MCSRIAVLISVGLVAAGGVRAHPQAEVSPQVTTAQGVLSGSRSAEVERFFNIPFAAAPVGDLRWRAPQPPPAWDGVRDASQLGPACPQPVRPAVVAGGIADNQSEDCLQLNVWRPKGARSLPVMVWIHGGANVLGSGTFPLFDGTAFARRGVVLVTINYRLGALGYFAHPALKQASQHDEPIGNYGLMDQIAALRWVQENIATFGGNPNQVTVFGESAGAIAISTMLAMPEVKGLFSGAILQSGVGLADLRELDQELLRGIEIAERAGARPDADATALRALPIEALLGASGRRNPGELTGPFIDETLVRDTPWRVIARKEVIDVPIMVGANSNEASVIRAMGVPPEAALAYLGDGKAGRAAYGDEIGDDELARQVLGDAWFVAPARWLADRAKAGAPTYLYHFDYVAEARRDITKGAAHGAEIAYVFGNLDYLESVVGAVTDSDRRFGEGIADCWVSFARTGAPACALAAGWPRYDSSTDRLALFSDDTRIVHAFRKAQIDHLLKVQAMRSAD